MEPYIETLIITLGRRSHCKLAYCSINTDLRNCYHNTKQQTLCRVMFALNTSSFTNMCPSLHMRSTSLSHSCTRATCALALPVLIFRTCYTRPPPAACRFVSELPCLSSHSIVLPTKNRPRAMFVCVFYIGRTSLQSLHQSNWQTHN